MSHILIVEDDAFLANIYKAKFEMEGFKVSLSEDGESGVADVKKKKPDIVLLGIALQKLDGFAVLKKLKAEQETKNIPVILMTNIGQKEDVEKGFALGSVDYIILRHFSPGETVEKVRKVLSS